MKTITISKTKFKPKTFEYLRRVEKAGETVVVTDHGRPVAEVVPYGRSARNALEAMRGLVLEFHDPTAPVDETWDADA
jgi:prevent-host-death family protein